MVRFLGLFLCVILAESCALSKDVNDLPKRIVGDWVFQYSEAKELVVDNNTVRDSIIADISNNKLVLGDQILSYSSDSTLKVISDDEISGGTYMLDDDVETYTFDGYSNQDIVSIVGDTLRADHDQTEYYQQQVYRYDLTDSDNSTVSKAIVSYIYTEKRLIFYDNLFDKPVINSWALADIVVFC